ncbi:MAG: thioredoxin domain-containing protein [Candidatus Kerfeldbacteria bacterium]|nr:thioredoxin domain-containing protein [Candidatus Kerfeldbacteria bacterium]
MIIDAPQQLDTPKQSQPVKSVLTQLPPRLAFFAGVVVTSGIIFAIGFVILVVMMFKGVDFATASTTTTTKTPEVTTTKTQPTGKIDLAAFDSGRIRGTGDITIVEYSDTECPFCKKFHPTMQQVLQDYDGKVRWAYKHLPLTSLHSKAPREANATLCANEQGKFWEYLDLLFERTPANNGLEDSELFTMADDVGLDRTAFADCVENDKYVDVVSQEAKEAQSLGGQGTPFSVIVDKDGNVLAPLSGALPYAQLQQALDQYVQ